jgi:hypothetical protein
MYYAFSAIVVLYIYTIQQQGSSRETLRYFDAAARCQSQISSLAERHSLAERYGVVLEELRLEAIRHMQSPNKTTVVQGNTINSAQSPQTRASAYAQPGAESSQRPQQERTLSSAPFVPNFQPGPYFSNPSPNDYYAEMTGWGQFDSMASDLNLSISRYSF